MLYIDIDDEASTRRADEDVSRFVEGHVAEWLRTGLQNRVRRFNSGRGLHKFDCSIYDPIREEYRPEPHSSAAVFAAISRYG